jgi:superfamily II DNA or RNA helicase
MVLEGLFGPVKKVTTTAELIEQKHLSAFKIKAIILQYPDNIRTLMESATYQQEIDWIVRCEPRNKFIVNLANSLKGNSLLLFQFVEKHGKVLEKMLRDSTDKPIFFVSGSVDGDEREEIRKIVETQENAIIIASYGTFSTGVNIKNLHNIIFGSPSKSRIRNLQSIGRGLRTSDNKEGCVLFDIADDMTSGKHRNTTINHFAERIKIYNEEKFSYKIYQVKLEV